jgi:hypothetical protein
MAEIGRHLLLIGVVLVIIGALVWGLGKAGFRGLPGDIRYETENIRVYIPIATSILISVLLTMALWLWQWLSRR